jgi:phosphocarrier protein HPr
MRREVQIINTLGLHARPAAEFVKCAMEFRSEILLRKGEERYSASSILEVLSANLDRGTKVTLEAVGPDAEEALDRLERLLQQFNDEEGGSS